MSIRYTIECMGFKHVTELCREHVYMLAVHGEYTAEHFGDMAERAGARAEVLKPKHTAFHVVIAFVKAGEP